MSLDKHICDVISNITADLLVGTTDEKKCQPILKHTFKQQLVLLLKAIKSH